MKKTVTKPDGTVIVYEGTAEEIKALEQGEVTVTPMVPGIPGRELVPFPTPTMPSYPFPDPYKFPDYNKLPIIWC